MATITLIAKEGDSVEVDWELITKSGTIKTLLDDLGFEPDTTLQPDPVPLNCEFKHLQLIVQWLEIHRDFTEPPDADVLKSGPNGKYIPPEDRALFESQHVDDIAYLMVAADYLDISILTKNLIRYTAWLIDQNNESPESIAKVLNMQRQK